LKNKKLSQIEEEEEAISNIDDANKSKFIPKEREMETGINNNFNFVPTFNTNLNRSKKKGVIPLLKAGFKTAYEGNYEKFLTNGDPNIMKNLNTMQVNGKNFHMFESIKNNNDIPFPEKMNKLNKDYTAEEGILEHIREESLQKNTIQSSTSKQNSSFQFITNKMSTQKNTKHRFFTGNGKMKFNFGASREQKVFNLQMDQDGNKNSHQRFYTKDPFQKRSFKEDDIHNHQEGFRSGSIGVTNNDITNNNQNVSINNKMNTYIIILKDENKKKELSKKFESQKKSETKLLLKKTDIDLNSKGKNM
jgi:hypothetical protein